MRKILLSKEGATLLIALLFFLLCSLAGSAVLAAGSAASGRVAGIATQEQSFYTVSSAAQTIRDDLADKSTVIITKNEGSEDTVEITSSSYMKEIVLAACQFVNSNKLEYKDELTISGIEGFEQVTGNFTMDKDYNIEIILFQTDDDNTYVCNLNMPASIPNSMDSNQMQIKWPKGIVGKG